MYRLRAPLWAQLSDRSKGSFDALWQSQSDKIIGGVKVVVSRLINDSHETVLLSGWVMKHGVELSYFQRGWIFLVANAEHELPALATRRGV